MVVKRRMKRRRKSETKKMVINKRVGLNGGALHEHAHSDFHQRHLF